ncbi:SRPBCC domain-containing protein [Viridibacillus sp. YIM B01967]|uniref:SRPBCC domain-containing protein n=1 Tax=Viridibacillus soli TaxID=2798301 RepID=A0ABS1H6N4_9BACL|nr:SRPBCC domain-containing protein [Viridibacillus soli]MBK3494688.1 SRPBCC domain-containing protein [Viridibacillus soli]
MTNNNQENLPDIKQTVLVNAPIQKVWNYVSTAEGIEAWFMPNDFQLEEGYEFHVQSPFGPSPCKVIEIDEPNRLSFEWDTDGWVVTFMLKEMGEQTEFMLIHGGWKNADAIVQKAQQPSSVIRATMEQGWVGIVQHKFKQVVEG